MIPTVKLMTEIREKSRVTKTKEGQRTGRRASQKHGLQGKKDEDMKRKRKRTPKKDEKRQELQVLHVNQSENDDKSSRETVDVPYASNSSKSLVKEGPEKAPKKFKSASALRNLEVTNLKTTLSDWTKRDEPAEPQEEESEESEEAEVEKSGETTTSTSDSFTPPLIPSDDYISPAEEVEKLRPEEVMRLGMIKMGLIPDPALSRICGKNACNKCEQDVKGRRWGHWAKWKGRGKSSDVPEKDTSGITGWRAPVKLNQEKPEPPFPQVRCSSKLFEHTPTKMKVKKNASKATADQTPTSQHSLVPGKRSGLRSQFEAYKKLKKMVDEEVKKIRKEIVVEVGVNKKKEETVEGKKEEAKLEPPPTSVAVKRVTKKVVPVVANQMELAKEKNEMQNQHKIVKPAELTNAEKKRLKEKYWENKVTLAKTDLRRTTKTPEVRKESRKGETRKDIEIILKPFSAFGKDPSRSTMGLDIRLDECLNEEDITAEKEEKKKDNKEKKEVKKNEKTKVKADKKKEINFEATLQAYLDKMKVEKKGMKKTLGGEELPKTATTTTPVVGKSDDKNVKKKQVPEKKEKIFEKNETTEKSKGSKKTDVEEWSVIKRLRAAFSNLGDTEKLDTDAQSPENMYREKLKILMQNRPPCPKKGTKKPISTDLEMNTEQAQGTKKPISTGLEMNTEQAQGTKKPISTGLEMNTEQAQGTEAGANLTDPVVLRARRERNIALQKKSTTDPEKMVFQLYQTPVDSQNQFDINSELCSSAENILKKLVEGTMYTEKDEEKKDGDEEDFSYLNLEDLKKGTLANSIIERMQCHKMVIARELRKVERKIADTLGYATGELDSKMNKKQKPNKSQVGSDESIPRNTFNPNTEGKDVFTQMSIAKVSSSAPFMGKRDPELLTYLKNAFPDSKTDSQEEMKKKLSLVEIGAKPKPLKRKPRLNLSQMESFKIAMRDIEDSFYKNMTIEKNKIKELRKELNLTSNESVNASSLDPRKYRRQRKLRNKREEEKYAESELMPGCTSSKTTVQTKRTKQVTFQASSEEEFETTNQKSITRRKKSKKKKSELDSLVLRENFSQSSGSKDYMALKEGNLIDKPWKSIRRFRKEKLASVVDLEPPKDEKGTVKGKKANIIRHSSGKASGADSVSSKNVSEKTSRSVSRPRSLCSSNGRTSTKTYTVHNTQPPKSHKLDDNWLIEKYLGSSMPQKAESSETLKSLSTKGSVKRNKPTTLRERLLEDKARLAGNDSWYYDECEKRVQSEEEREENVEIGRSQAEEETDTEEEEEDNVVEEGNSAVEEEEEEESMAPRVFEENKQNDKRSSIADIMKEYRQMIRVKYKEVPAWEFKKTQWSPSQLRPKTSFQAAKVYDKISDKIEDRVMLETENWGTSYPKLTGLLRSRIPDKREVIAEATSQHLQKLTELEMEEEESSEVQEGRSRSEVSTTDYTMDMSPSFKLIAKEHIEKIESLVTSKSPTPDQLPPHEPVNESEESDETWESTDKGRGTDNDLDGDSERGSLQRESVRVSEGERGETGVESNGGEIETRVETDKPTTIPENIGSEDSLALSCQRLLHETTTDTSPTERPPTEVMKMDDEEYLEMVRRIKKTLSDDLKSLKPQEEVEQATSMSRASKNVEVELDEATLGSKYMQGTATKISWTPVGEECFEKMGK